MIQNNSFNNIDNSLTSSENNPGNAGTIFFGYHPFNYEKEDQRKIALLINVINFFSYIPVVSTIIGIARLVFASIVIYEERKKLAAKQELKKRGFIDQAEIDNINQDKRELRQFAAAMITRGVVETCSLGFVFIIVDIVFSIIRTTKEKTKF